MSSRLAYKKRQARKAAAERAKLPQPNWLDIAEEMYRDHPIATLPGMCIYTALSSYNLLQERFPGRCQLAASKTLVIDADPTLEDGLFHTGVTPDWIGKTVSSIGIHHLHTHLIDTVTGNIVDFTALSWPASFAAVGLTWNQRTVLPTVYVGKGDQAPIKYYGTKPITVESLTRYLETDLETGRNPIINTLIAQATGDTSYLKPLGLNVENREHPLNITCVYG